MGCCQSKQKDVSDTMIPRVSEPPRLRRSTASWSGLSDLGSTRATRGSNRHFDTQSDNIKRIDSLEEF